MKETAASPPAGSSAVGQGYVDRIGWHGSRILLVEDDEFLAAEVALLLQDAGHEVTSLADGAEASALTETATFDLLVVDRMLPGLDGLDLVERIRLKDRQMPVSGRQRPRRSGRTCPRAQGGRRRLPDQAVRARGAGG